MSKIIVYASCVHIVLVVTCKLHACCDNRPPLQLGVREGGFVALLHMAVMPMCNLLMQSAWTDEHTSIEFVQNLCTVITVLWCLHRLWFMVSYPPAQAQLLELLSMYLFWLLLTESSSMPYVYCEDIIVRLLNEQMWNILLSVLADRRNRKFILLTPSH